MVFTAVSMPVSMRSLYIGTGPHSHSQSQSQTQSQSHSHSAPLFNEHQQPVGRFGRCWWSLKRVRTYHHTPSPTSTQQHPPFILKPTSGTGFCEKRYHPLDAPLTPNPPSPRLVKVDEAICKCPSRAKKGTTHACLSRACHYSTLIHLGEGWPGIKNTDHWMVSFFAKTGIHG